MRPFWTANCGLALALTAALVARPARAEVPRFLHVEGFSQLLDGNPETTTLGEDGSIGLRPRVHTRFADAAFVGGAAGLYMGEVAMARMDGEAQLVAIDARGKTRTLLPLGERLVTRVVGEGDVLWLATTGKDGAALQRLRGPGKIEAVAFGKARFIWDVLPLADGRGVLLATGEPGQVVHLNAKGAAKVLFESEEAHIKSLAFNEKLGTFAGGGERGVVYVGDAPQAYAGTKARPFRALLDSRNSEISALVSNGNHVFVAAVSGSMLPAAVEGGELGAGQAGAKPASEVRSTLLRVDVQGRTDVLAASTDEMIFALAKDADGQVLVATGSTSKVDPRGRLYRVDPDHKVLSLVYQAPSRRLTQLLARPGDGPILVSQEGTRLVELSSGVDEEGTYFGAPLDAGMDASFGLVQVLGDFPPGSKGEVSVRTGQTREPDKSWSKWSKAVAANAYEGVDVANGRYAQMRLHLHGKQNARPFVHRMRLTYLRHNLPPFIREVVAMEKGVALHPLPAGLGGDDGRNKVVALAEKNDEAAAMAARAPLRARQSVERGALTLKWLVDEPNGDELVYTLWMRPSGGGSWQLVKDELEEPFYTFHSAQLADGHYTFRVQASDARVNPAGLERSDSKDSHAVLVDNTPPVFAGIKVKVRGHDVDISGRVSDAASPLTALSYALDGAPLRPLNAVDGMVDGLHEQLQFTLPALAGGAHTLMLRARDEADNEAHAQLQFTVR